MSMVRYLLADNFCFSWEDIKYTPAHIVRQYITDIEKAKNHFKGVRRQDVQKFADAAKSAGVNLD